MAIKEMTGTEAVRDVMKHEMVTHAQLAQELGYRSVSGVTGRLSTPRISADKLVEMLGAMGYEVIVRKREEYAHGGEERTEWRIVG